MELQVTAHELVIIKDTLSEKLKRTEGSLEWAVKEIKEAIQMVKEWESRDEYHSAGNLNTTALTQRELWGAKLIESRYKRDILMEEVYQLEKLLHEVSITQEHGY